MPGRALRRRTASSGVRGPGARAPGSRSARRGALLVAGLTALVAYPTPAGAHPGHAVEPVLVDGDAFAFVPAAVTIRARRSVRWTWQGTLFRNHSVTADPGQRESFDSDPAGPPSNADHPPGDTFTHTFNRAGTYTYHCKVHPEMIGSVEVLPLPGSRPRLKRLRVRDGRACADGSCRPALARFRASKGVIVVGRIERPRGSRWRVVRSFSRVARKGANRLRLPTRSLAAGRYRLSLRAYDRYDRGSRQRRARFALR